MSEEKEDLEKETSLLNSIKSSSGEAVLLAVARDPPNCKDADLQV